MSNNPNVIAVGPCVDSRVTVKFTGPLSEHINGLKRYVQQVEDVRGNAHVVLGESIIVAYLGTKVTDEQAAQARIRIRNRCRDYMHDVTGYLTNTVGSPARVDLEEDMPRAVA